MKKQNVRLIVVFVLFIVLISFIAFNMIRVEGNYLKSILEIFAMVVIGTVLSIPLVYMENRKVD